MRDLDQHLEHLAAKPVALDASGFERGVLRRIAALRDGLKAPLILCALVGHSHKEAAAMLDLTRKAVELRKARARQKLTEVLGS